MALKEFVKSQHYEAQHFLERLAKMTMAFDSYVDFLRDPERFPNKEINELTTLMWKLIGNKDIPVILDQWKLPSMSFAVTGKGIETTAFFIMPQDFLEQINANPAKQLGIITYMGSQGRDYYTGKIKQGTSQIVNTRARIYEAESMITLNGMAEKEGVKVEWDSMQQDYLNQFPQGIKSAPSGLLYPTPKYVFPRGRG